MYVNFKVNTKPIYKHEKAPWLEMEQEDNRFNRLPDLHVYAYDLHLISKE